MEKQECKEQKALKGLECCRSVPCKCSECPYEPKDLDDIRRNYEESGNSHACSRAQLIYDLGMIVLKDKVTF